MNAQLWQVQRILAVWYLGAVVAGITCADEIDTRRPLAIQTTNVPAIPQSVADGLRRYQSVRSAKFRGWSPDDKGILVQTQFGNSAQLHRVYEPGGRREQITFQEEPVDGRFLTGTFAGELLVESSKGGDENYQLYRLRKSNGKLALWTDGKSRNMLGPVNRSGDWALVASNRVNKSDMDLFKVSLNQSGDWQQVLAVKGLSWQPTDISPDHQTALVYRWVSITESHPKLLHLASGELKPFPLPPQAKGPVAYSDLKFSPDGRHVYLACNARSEFKELCRVELATGAYEWLSTDWPWDVESIEVDENTGTVAVLFNENAASAACLLREGKLQRIPLPLGVVESMEFSSDSKHLGFTLAKPDGPAEAYSWKLGNSDSADNLVRWTYSEIGGLDSNRFVTPKRIQFTSFDGRMIPAYAFVPPTATRDRKVPVVVQIHGGPEAQYRPTFSGIEQYYLAEMGVAVISPNVRGSDGYGKTYLQLDNAEKREDSVKDIGALLDWINTQPELDSSRVMVVGGSYGGYMVLASLTHFSDRLKGGIDIVGIANFVTFLENTADYRRDLRRVEYGDERDPAMRAVFDRINPSSNVHKIRTALMVIHGKNDPRVPFSEAELIAPLVAKNNVPVWTLYADNEGHGFRKRDNRDYMSAAMVLFIARQLQVNLPE